jgi:hypothetical protein
MTTGTNVIDGQHTNVIAQPGDRVQVAQADTVAQENTAKLEALAATLGQRIQVKTIDTALLQKNQEPTPGVVHWIYADVLEVMQTGALLVQIEHPGNISHGVRKVVKAGGYRTKQDLEADLAALPENPTLDTLKDLRRSLQVQIDLLT